MPKDETKKTIRDWHYTDEPKSPSLAYNDRKRTIGNFLNYKDRNGEWRKCAPRLRNAEPGDTFFGMELKKVGDAGALDFFIGRPNAMGGRPWWGIRKSDSELDKGIVFFIENGVDSDNPVFDADKRSVMFPNILPDTDLYIYSNTHFLEKWIALNTATSGEGGTGNRVDIGIIVPNNWTVVVDNNNTDGNRIRILNGQGEEKFRSRPARAVDSSTLGFEGGPREVPCRFNALAKGTLGGVEYWRVRIRCTSAGYTRPILMDPTVTISGTVSLEDNALLSANALNYGGGNTVYFGFNNNRHGIVRASTATIPAGTVTSAKFYIYTTQTALTYLCYRIPAADADWVEGTSIGAATAGESSWLWKSNPATTWTVNGCGKVEDGTETSTVFGAGAGDAWRVLTVAPSWFTGWKAGTFPNGGFLFTHVSGTASTANSTEAPNNQLYLELEYLPPYTHQFAGIIPITNTNDSRPTDGTTRKYITFGKNLI